MSSEDTQTPWEDDEDEDEDEWVFGPGPCDLCGIDARETYRQVLFVCRICNLNFDDILNGLVEQFSIAPEPAPRPLLAELCKQQKGICGICKKRIEPWERQHIDHIIPRSKGGSDERSNLQAAHAVCNQRKGNRMPSSEGGTTTRGKAK